MFEFRDFAVMTDGEIDLILEEKLPADITKGYVPAYLFKITLHDTCEEIGGIVLRVGYSDNIYYSGHIGYGISEKYRGHNYSAKACILLKKVAEIHDMDRLYITCNPDNIPSRKICDKIGAKLKEIIDIPVTDELYQDGERKKCIYELLINQNL